MCSFKGTTVKFVLLGTNLSLVERLEWSGLDRNVSLNSSLEVFGIRKLCVGGRLGVYMVREIMVRVTLIEVGDVVYSDFGVTDVIYK